MPTALKAAEPTRYSDTSRPARPYAPPPGRTYALAMKKLVLIVALIVLAGVAAKKARHV